MAAKTFSMNVTFSVEEKGKKRPDYNLDSDAKGQMTLKDLLEWHRQILMATAVEVTKEEQARGFTKNPIVLTDGKHTGRIDAVQPLGNIEISAPVQADLVLAEIFKGLLYRSKEVTGQYINSHRVVYNKQQVADDFFSFKAWLAKGIVFNPGDELIFVNAAPYARKLERLGVTAQRTKSMDKKRKVKSKDKKLRSADSAGKILAPDGTYFLTYKSVKKRFKANVNIKFTFLSGSYLGLSGVFKTVRGQGRKALDPNSKEGKSPRAYLYPAIVLTFRAGGIL